MAAEYDDQGEPRHDGGFRLTGAAVQPVQETTAARIRVEPVPRRGRHPTHTARSARGWLIATVACVTAIGGLSLWVGPSAVMAPWDVFTLLNGAFRIYHGQAPSTDFSNPIGPLVYGLAAIGMHFSLSLRAVTYSQVIFVAIVSPLAWTVSSRRLPAPYAAGFTVFAAWLAISVRPLAYSYKTMSYAMLYNTDAWLLYATLLLLVLLPRRNGGQEDSSSARRHYLVDGLLLGFLLGLLCYDKITFFLAGLVAAGVGLALSTLPRSLRLGVSALAGFAVVSVLVELIFRLNITSYFHDLIEAAVAQAADRRTAEISMAIKWNLPNGLIAVVLAMLLVFATHRHGRQWRPLVFLLISAAFVIVSSIVLSAGDAPEKSDVPALVVIPLLAIAFLEPQLPRWAGGSAATRPLSWPRRSYRLLLLGLATLLATTSLPIAGQDALAIGKAISYRSYVANPPASQRFNAAPLADFVIPANTDQQTAYRASRALPEMINNGLALLRQNVRPGQSVFTLAYTDPFYLAMNLPLSSCGPLWWDLNYDFTRTDHASAQCAIGDAAWVIIPRMIPGQGCCQNTVSVILSLYSGYLSRYYHQVRQTADWTLLRRDSS